MKLEVTLVTLALVAGPMSLVDGLDAPVAPVDCSPRIAIAHVDDASTAHVSPPSGFTSHDAVNVSVAIWHEGPSCPQALNAPPQLRSAWVDPLWGPSTAPYTFRVTYADADGDAPAHVRATIDGRLSLELQPVTSSNRDYATGVDFVGYFPGRLAMGMHNYSFTGSDGIGETATTILNGPRVVDAPSGTVDVPNPLNRLLIHPLANGPTLVPPSEVPPAALPGLGSPQQGISSYLISLDPDAAGGHAEYSLFQVGGLDILRDGGMEILPGTEYGNQLLGSAKRTYASRSGAWAVDLAPPGSSADARGLLGGIDWALRPDFPFAQVSHVEFWYRQEEPLTGASPSDVAPTLSLRVELDMDRDGRGDSCLTHGETARPAASWQSYSVGPQTTFNLRGASCEIVSPEGEPSVTSASLSDLQANPLFGLSRITRFVLQSEAAPGEALQSSEARRPLLIDDASFVLVARSDADFDACFYPPAPDGSPISCISDLGPHGSAIPAGASRVNVWADTLAPSGLAIERSYVEPGSFMFVQSRRGEIPLPPPASVAYSGSLVAGEDENGNGQLDPAEPVLAQIGGIVPTATVGEIRMPVPLNPAPNGMHRSDGPVPLLFEYDDGLPPNRTGLPSSRAQTSLIVQRFVNDNPWARLEVSDRQGGGRRIEFTVTAGDADDGQGPMAQTLGGFRSWQLDFGDGSPVIEGETSPFEVSHRYDWGKYRATLTAYDYQESMGNSIVDVTVWARKESRPAKERTVPE